MYRPAVVGQFEDPLPDQPWHFPVKRIEFQFSCRSHCPNVIELSCDLHAPIDSHWFSPRSSGAVTGRSAMNAKGAPKATAGARANGRKKSNNPSYVCCQHLRVTRQRGREIFSTWREKVLPQGFDLWAVRAERRKGNVSLARTDGAGFSANRRTGRQSAPRLLRAAALVFRPGGRV